MGHNHAALENPPRAMLSFCVYLQGGEFARGLLASESASAFAGAGG